MVCVIRFNAIAAASMHTDLLDPTKTIYLAVVHHEYMHHYTP